MASRTSKVRVRGQDGAVGKPRETRVGAGLSAWRKESFIIQDSGISGKMRVEGLLMTVSAQDVVEQLPSKVWHLLSLNSLCTKGVGSSQVEKSDGESLSVRL